MKSVHFGAAGTAARVNEFPKLGTDRKMKEESVKSRLTLLVVFLLAVTAGASEIAVRPDGPIRTLAEAQREARKSKTTVVVHAGTYYLPETLVFTSE